MNRHLLIAGLVLYTLVFLPVASAGEKSTKPELSCLDGSWRIVDFRFTTYLANEESIPLDDETKQMVFAVKEGKVKYRDKDRDREFQIAVKAVAGGINELDVWNKNDDPNLSRENAIKCIFVVENNTLKVRCHFAVARWGSVAYGIGIPRPTSFAPSGPTITVTLQRQCCVSADGFGSICADRIHGCCRTNHRAVRHFGFRWRRTSGLGNMQP